MHLLWSLSRAKLVTARDSHEPPAKGASPKVYTKESHDPGPGSNPTWADIVQGCAHVTTPNHARAHKPSHDQARDPARDLGNHHMIKSHNPSHDLSRGPARDRSHDLTRDPGNNTSHDLPRDWSSTRTRDPMHFGYAKRPLIGTWQTVGSKQDPR
jgi:hypothetical protein